MNRHRDGFTYFKKNDKRVWDLDNYLARIIYEGLSRYRQMTVDAKEGTIYGIPNDLKEEDWKKILNKMIWSFFEISHYFPGEPFSVGWDKFYKEHPDVEPFVESKKESNGMYSLVDNPKAWKPTPEIDKEREQYSKDIQDGIDLFAKYYQDLWI